MDDTIDFSALDALSSSSTPRILQQDRRLNAKPSLDGHKPEAGDTKNNNNNDNKPLFTDPEDAGSDYSIHLSAIGLRSDASTVHAERDNIKIDSEDVGGPSDFTLNMADWMSGPRESKQSDTQGVNPTKQDAADMHIQPTIQPQAVKAMNEHSRASSGEPIESSECLAMKLPGPQDVRSQMLVLQRQCESLQAKNDELNHMLEDLRLQRSREADVLVRLENERRLRQEERLASQEARRSVERELQTEKDRTRALQAKLTEGQILAAQNQVNSELAQQDIIAQSVVLKQRAEQTQRELDELRLIQRTSEEADHTSRTETLQQQLAAQQLSHKNEIDALREEYVGVARDVDDWVVAQVRKKEEHYTALDLRRQAEVVKLKTRNRELESLFQMAGKQLLLEWGKQEIGLPRSGEKQKYRYQHA